MNRILLIASGGMVPAILCLPILARHGQASSEAPVLPPIETFVLQPIDLNTLSVWIPADKDGPVINRGCQLRRNCIYSCLLPADVQHAKADNCPDEVARLLAEYAARYHEQSLPLTIFNGWQWEYSYSLCQFEATHYELGPHGLSWENSLEAVLTRTLGSVAGEWIRIPSQGNAPENVRANPPQSCIEVTTFNSMRTRDGYPKIRQF